MLKTISERILSIIPEVRLPRLTHEVEIPVFLIHNSPDAEDYFFLIDFEDFVERSEKGFFVRPRLQIWAGRDDFGRTDFAVHFRKVFAAEFDRMRAELGKRRGRGWLSWSLVAEGAGVFVSGLAAHLVLMIATGMVNVMSNMVTLPGWMKSKSDAAKLEDEIARTKAKVDRALETLEVKLHRDLYDHAFRAGRRGPVSGIVRDAWPLPGFVRAHLDDGRSGSWW